jgi:hypothetical protein
MVKNLHPLEVKVILRYGAGDELSASAVEADLGLKPGNGNQALSWLAAKVRSFVRFGGTPAMLESARRVEAVLEHFRKASRKSYNTATGGGRLLKEPREVKSDIAVTARADTPVSPASE